TYQTPRQRQNTHPHISDSPTAPKHTPAHIRLPHNTKTHTRTYQTPPQHPNTHRHISDSHTTPKHTPPHIRLPTNTQTEHTHTHSKHTPPHIRLPHNTKTHTRTYQTPPQHPNTHRHISDSHTTPKH